MPIIKLRITRVLDVIDVMILPHKGTNLYSYINLTKGHICPCKFDSVESAIADLDTYSQIVSYERLGD